MRFLPVFLDLSRGVVALVGAGPAAISKLRLLQSAAARVRWYALGDGDIRAFSPDAPSGTLEISAADPRRADFSEFVAVVSAAGDALDDEIAARARAGNVPVNVVDRSDLSTSFFPRSSIAATWSLRSAPGARRRSWRAGCASASKRCCQLASAILRP